MNDNVDILDILDDEASPQVVDAVLTEIFGK